MPHTIILGGGIAGLTAAWQLHQLGRSFTLYEASDRLGGTVRTLHREGFVLEQGPDGWVTEKPWAAELARDLGLAHQLTPSLDEGRITWILRNGKLLPIPDGMRMMVPTSLAALENSPLLSREALAAYAAEPARAAELKAEGPHHHHDESVAHFVLRHFGPEVLNTLAAPLLSGVFGGDVHKLSVRAVMPAFVQMERDHGSLILALQAKNRPERAAQHTIFTTLRDGVQTLADTMAATLPPGSVHLNTPIASVCPAPTPGPWKWTVQTGHGPEHCDHLLLATPAHVTRQLLPELLTQPHGFATVRPGQSMDGPGQAMDAQGQKPGPHPAEIAPQLLPAEASSALLVTFAFNQSFPLPAGFGFLVPHGEVSRLLAATFVDQKFPHRAPPGKRLLRAFFGGAEALALDASTDEILAQLALSELEKILGPLPSPAFHHVQRWPQSLPQYEVGHQERIAQLTRLLPPNLHLLGNAYHGVGLPDLIRDARATARHLADR